ncbi:VapC toxin family PIN domain ribonuclease [Mycobacterium alsense]|uniref:Type II toxin-antitoxin system VapC family toxin n=1 Tax=Mycobacterium alsense TaxID=324058 RepID=A0AA41XP48_9MYCO|nr:type II toxin-antitoxin system VapC family toxin [Mycobacterium alsense]MCV7379846.1 type II toxin-antitoxin system VapC family toxin [Mycobacterium alsense]OQZ91115.1 VapC toxin family PIN domain ribonuclease [Mycobacterium alsense]
MIGYLDASALVPLLIDEPSSAACRRLWDDAEVIVSSRLLYVETAAALAQALRMARLSAGQHRDGRRRLEAMWSQMDVIEIDEHLVNRAAELAYRLNLRGYDAMHAASAEQLDDDDDVAASGDQRLLTAWMQLGMSTYDTTQTPTPPE